MRYEAKKSVQIFFGTDFSIAIVVNLSQKFGSGKVRTFNPKNRTGSGIRILKKSGLSSITNHQPSINHKIRLQAELQIKPSLGKGAQLRTYRGEAAKLPLLHVCRLIRGREKPNPSSLNLLLLPSRHEKWKKEIFRQDHCIVATTQLK